MKRKADIQKAHKEAVDFMQTIIHKGKHDIERCAGFQDALLWVLGRSDYHAYKKKKEETNEFDGL
jgi:hypothetical protein